MTMMIGVIAILLVTPAAVVSGPCDLVQTPARGFGYIIKSNNLWFGLSDESHMPDLVVHIAAYPTPSTAIVSTLNRTFGGRARVKTCKNMQAEAPAPDLYKTAVALFLEKHPNVASRGCMSFQLPRPVDPGMGIFGTVTSVSSDVGDPSVINILNQMIAGGSFIVVKSDGSTNVGTIHDLPPTACVAGTVPTLGFVVRPYRVSNHDVTNAKVELFMSGYRPLEYDDMEFVMRIAKHCSPDAWGLSPPIPVSADTEALEQAMRQDVLRYTHECAVKAPPKPTPAPTIKPAKPCFGLCSTSGTNKQDPLKPKADSVVMPMVCSRGPGHTLYRLPEEPSCTTDLGHWREAKIYKRNIKEFTSDGFSVEDLIVTCHCTRYFFGSLDQIFSSRTIKPPTNPRTEVCSSGTKPGDLTPICVDKWCQSIYTDRQVCRVVKGTVTIGADGYFTSSIGPMDGCKYADGACNSVDGRAMRWKVLPEALLPYAFGRNINVTIEDGHAIDKDNLESYVLHTVIPCQKVDASLAPSYVCYETSGGFALAVHQDTHKKEILRDPKTDLAARIEAVENEVTAMMQYWKDKLQDPLAMANSTCYLSKVLYRVLRNSISKTPTETARALMNIHYIKAVGGGDHLMVWPCSAVEWFTWGDKNFYEAKTGNFCSSYPSINFRIGNETGSGFLLAGSQEIVSKSNYVSCTSALPQLIAAGPKTYVFISPNPPVEVDMSRVRPMPKIGWTHENFTELHGWVYTKEDFEQVDPAYEASHSKYTKPDLPGEVHGLPGGSEYTGGAGPGLGAFSGVAFSFSTIIIIGIIIFLVWKCCISNGKGVKVLTTIQEKARPKPATRPPPPSRARYNADNQAVSLE